MQENAPLPAEKPGYVTKKLGDIPIVPFGAVANGKFYDMEPTPQEIQAAIDANEFDERPYSENSAALLDEWTAEAKGVIPEVARLQRHYHARRIAYLAVKGWTDPIRMDANGGFHDGQHRLKAAKFLGRETIEVQIDPVPDRTGEDIS